MHKFANAWTVGARAKGNASLLWPQVWGEVCTWWKHNTHNMCQHLADNRAFVYEFSKHNERADQTISPESKEHKSQNSFSIRVWQNIFWKSSQDMTKTADGQEYKSKNSKMSECSIQKLCVSMAKTSKLITCCKEPSSPERWTKYGLMCLSFHRGSPHSMSVVF